MQSTSLFRTLRHNFHQFWVAIDQLLNVLVSCCFCEKAWADETLSAHAWRWHLDGAREWPRRMIDVLTFMTPNGITWYGTVAIYNAG
jgi:hypothetical protein